MNQKSFNGAVAVVMTLAGALHLVRSLAGWDLTLNGVVIPIWLSVLVAIILGYLVYTASRLNKKT